jgi:hypothetical protein
MNYRRNRNLIQFNLIAAAVAASLTASAVAAADEATVEHAKRARVAYDVQDWPTAIQEYRAAYTAEQKPEYLFALAQAQRQSGDCAAAIASYKAFKRLDSVTPQQGTAAELLITKCEGLQAKAEAEAARRNAAPTASAAAPPAIAAAPGTPAPRSTALTSTSGPDDRAGGAPKRFYEDLFGDSLFVAGVGMASVGTYLFVRGSSDMNQAASSATEASADSLASSAHGKEVAGEIMIPVGGALVAGAVVRWLTMGSGETPVTTGVWLSPRYIGYTGKF